MLLRRLTRTPPAPALALAAALAAAWLLPGAVTLDAGCHGPCT